MKLAMTIFIASALMGCNYVASLSGAHGEKTITTYTVEVKPLDCIHIPYGLSCNWDKYDKGDQ